MRRGQQLGADVAKTALTVDKSAIHAYFGVHSPSRSDIVANRLLHSQS